MRNLYTFILLSALFLLPSTARATHIVGGEMTYTCLGNNMYQIKLTIFRDCYNGVPWFDSPASIGFFRINDTDTPHYKILVPLDLMLNDTLDPDLGSECFVAPPNVCVHTTSYTTTVELPYIPGGYNIVYQRCCRNVTISNLISPEDVGATYSIQIGDQALLECNSSPEFNNWPPLYLCVNQPFSIDQSAVDPDGDSLVYVLCDPLNGANPADPMPQPPNAPPYFQVPWLDPPYNVNNQIGGMPVMAIDPVTGLLTGTPNTIGQFVIGICVEEYRNGVLIGTKRRDYQVNIGVCDIATAAFFTPDLVCKSFTVNVQNQSLSADDFLWFFNDPNNPGATSTLPNPTYTYSDTGLYNIVLIAEPGTVCSDTFSAQVQILPHSIFANFNIVNVDCADSLTIQVTDSSLDTLSSVEYWQWTLQYGTTTVNSTLQNPIFVIKESGQAKITLVVTADNGCTDTLTQTFPVVFLNDPDLNEVVAICKGDGDAVELNPNGAFPGATYNWTPPDFLDDPTSPNPLASPDTTTTYTVSIDDANGFCHIEKSVTIIVSPEVTVTPLLDTILQGQSVPIFATEDPTYTYVWSPANWLDFNDIPNPVATPDESITYTLTVTDTNGCVVERNVVIFVLTLCEEPYVFVPTGFTPNGDGKNDTFKVIGNNLDEVYIAVYNRWGEKVFESKDPAVGWDGTYKGKLLPPDAYGFYVQVKCFGGLDFFKKGNVTLLR
ncbi:MAG: gliding motility-associated C-terminal domain-containing protein [Bacteroidetes bacterium]|nr:gliding motility-associated C-terminal domain-containing protein [Bacteroidota bacterium]